jgi:NAD+ synthase
MEKRIKLPQMDPELVSHQIGDFVIDAIKEFNYNGAVIGLSGGVDSTTTAAVVQTAFERYNKRTDSPLELVGYILPTKINPEKDTEDGIRVAKQLGIRYEVHEIDSAVEGYRHILPRTFESQIGTGNLISQVRGSILSRFSADECKILLGTGNKDEDYGLGYYTMFGDGLAHISPIGNLSKRLVKDLAAYNKITEDLVFREPSAGLEIGQTDFKDMGYKYDLAELVIEGKDQGFTREELIVHSQIKPLAEYYIKIQEKPKLTSVEAIVDDIFQRNICAQGKQRIIHPPCAPVTLYYIS